ncbi:hypothetical protein M6B38_389505 [Iris pallida]|uniref:Uncharacterized protein n=1 Tax=Iris pallida TaxID=29817 RepID=A0AAX6G1R7_IRIPA|nr:hypothetical protein M6B38_389505 [Iris pallida]
MAPSPTVRVAYSDRAALHHEVALFLSGRWISGSRRRSSGGAPPFSDGGPTVSFALTSFLLDGWRSPCVRVRRLSSSTQS